MPYSIFWSEFAERQLETIFDFYIETANITVAKKIIQNIIKTSNRLKESPFIGPKESLLENRKNQFRYLIYGNHKIIYFVKDRNKTVHISDVFDTRQNPIKLNRSKQ